MTDTKINVLMPFDVVLDLDMGLAMLLYFKYDNPEYIKTDLMKDENLLKQTLVYRSDENPLSVLYKYPEDKETVDSLYDQFLEQEYDEILKLSNLTDLINLFKLTNKIKDNDLNFTILCPSEKEQAIFKQRRVPIKTIVADREKLDLTPYGNIYLRTPSDLLAFDKDQIYTKNIFVANYDFNLILDNITHKLYLNLAPILEYTQGRHLDFYIFNLYKFDKKLVKRKGDIDDEQDKE